LQHNDNGSHNTAFGLYSLYDNTTGKRNNAFGSYSLFKNTTGRDNVAIGQNALSGNTVGLYNIAIGSSSGYCTTIMDDTYSCIVNKSGFDNIFIGSFTNPEDNGDQNEIVIGYYAKGNGSNTVTIGNDGIENTYLKGKIYVPSGKDVCIIGGHCLSELEDLESRIEALENN